MPSEPVRAAAQSLAPKPGSGVSLNWHKLTGSRGRERIRYFADNGRSARCQCPAGVFQEFCVESDVER